MNEREQILLVLRAQTGDKEAYNKLLSSLEDSLYWYIYSTLSNKSLAKDILQEVFIIIYKKLPRLRQPEYFKTWCYRITSREIFRAVKKNKQLFENIQVDQAIDDISADEDVPLENDFIINKLFDLIDILPPASRAVLSLHYKNKVSLSEISTILNISAGTVKSRLSYGLKILRDRIQSNHEYNEQIQTD